MDTKAILERMKKRLTKDEKKLLGDVYAPRDVVVPPADAWGGLCVLRDGRIRFYGTYAKNCCGSDDSSAPDCYLESGDCGLSWKKRFVRHEGVLGASVYVPSFNRYCKVVIVKGKGTFFRFAKSPDDVARELPISEKEYIDVRLPFIHSTGRIIVVAHERRQELHPTCFFAVLLITDDFGKTWKEIKLPAVPFFEKHGAHKGYRWQQNNRENTIEELSDGTLVMLSRTALDYHYVSYSYDHGDTWTTPAPSRFHSTATMPYLKKLSDAVYRVLGQEDNLSAELEFVSEEEIADLNKQFRKVEGVTDVLSFPSLDGVRGKVIYRKDFPFDVEDKAVFIGSVAVCVKRAEQQAEEYGHSTEREFTYLVCHGLLHLFGYDHMTEDDKKEMRALEDKIMAEIDVLRD